MSQTPGQPRCGNETRQVAESRFEHIGEPTTTIEDRQAQQAKAVKTLEKKINQGLKDGEAITNVELHVDDQNMISGTVSGEGFSLTVKSIWNYRYGENSANGILTVYAQTRVNRKEA